MGFSSACFTHALFSAYMVYKFSSKVSMHHAPHRIKALSAISLAFDTKVIELKSQIGLQPQENIFGLLESILMKRSFHPPSSSLHEKKTRSDLLCSAGCSSLTPQPFIYKSFILNFIIDLLQSLHLPSLSFHSFSFSMKPSSLDHFFLQIMLTALVVILTQSHVIM